MKKCFLCDKFFVFGGGHIAVEGEDYEITKPICQACHKNMEREYANQQKAEPKGWE